MWSVWAWAWDDLDSAKWAPTSLLHQRPRRWAVSAASASPLMMIQRNMQGRSLVRKRVSAVTSSSGATHTIPQPLPRPRRGYKVRQPPMSIPPAPLFFPPRVCVQHVLTLSVGFEGATSISSNAYFGRPEEDVPEDDYGDLEGAAKDFIRKFGVTAGDDLENLTSMLGEGATKLQGAIRSYLNS